MNKTYLLPLDQTEGPPGKEVGTSQLWMLLQIREFQPIAQKKWHTEKTVHGHVNTFTIITQKKLP